MEEYEFDLDEFEPTKPYTAEQQAAIAEIMSEIASALAEINGYEE